VFFLDEEHQVTEDPRETDRHVDRNINPEFFLSIPLIRFRGTSKSLVDFSTDEEEQYPVARENDKPRDKESHKTRKIIINKTLSFCSVSDGPVVLRSSNSNDKGRWKPPRKQMIPLLEPLRLSIPPDDHLIKVEGDTKGPTPIRHEEVVDQDGDRDTRPVIRRYSRFVRGDKS